MKKNILLLAALTAGIAQAAIQPEAVLSLGNSVPQPLSNITMLPQIEALNQQADLTPVTPEGEPYDCYISFKQQGMDGFEFYDMDIQVSLSDDGTAVYFSNLFPKFQTDASAWTKGEIQEDGTILLPVQFVMNYAGTYNLYAGGFDMTTYEMHDISFVVDENGSISQADPEEMLMLAALDEEGKFVAAGMYQNNTCIYTEPKANLNPVVVPETAVSQEFIYSFNDGYLNHKLVKGLVAEDGDDVYFNGLAPEIPGAWAKGTKEGNTVTIKSGQYLGYAKGYQLELRILEVLPDYSEFWEVDECTLTYDAETQTYKQVRESENDNYFFFAEALTSGTLYFYNFNFEISYYPGDVACKPAAPTSITLYNFYEAQGRNCIYFNNTGLGVNGEYLDPANLYYQIYMDDELYTLPAEYYTSLDEDLTLIPWNFGDNRDFFYSSAYHYVYVYDCLFETMGAQIVYFFEGEPYYSDILTSDWEGNQTITEVGDITAIRQVKGNGAMQYFDLEGHRLSKPQAGINVIKMTQADGSIKTYKTLVK